MHANMYIYLYIYTYMYMHISEPKGYQVSSLVKCVLGHSQSWSSQVNNDTVYVGIYIYIYTYNVKSYCIYIEVHIYIYMYVYLLYVSGWAHGMPSHLKWIQVRWSEYKRDLVFQNESRWHQEGPCDINWVHWVQVISRKIKWIQMRPSESK